MTRLDELAPEAFAVGVARAAYVTASQRAELAALPEWQTGAVLLDETPADWPADWVPSQLQV